jgi:hypothetical protein
VDLASGGPVRVARRRHPGRALSLALAAPATSTAQLAVKGALVYPMTGDQQETSAPVQPELRAIDAYNGRDPLVAWVRNLGVTTVQTGHAPGALVSG